MMAALESIRVRVRVGVRVSIRVRVRVRVRVRRLEEQRADELVDEDLGRHRRGEGRAPLELLRDL